MTRKGGSYTRASMEEISITAIVDHRVTGGGSSCDGKLQELQGSKQHSTDLHCYLVVVVYKNKQINKNNNK